MSAAFYPVTRKDQEKLHKKQIEFQNLLTRDSKAGLTGRGRLDISTNGTKGLAYIFVDEWFGDHEENHRYCLTEAAFRSIRAVGSGFLLDCSR
jgi:hypothetical protein